jgi:hypothetical protein
MLLAMRRTASAVCCPVVTALESGGDFRPLRGMEIKGRKRVESTMAKYSKPEVHYRPTIGGAKRRCSNCINYREAESGCTMVEGSIEPNFVCNLWKLKPPAQAAK